MAVQIGWEVILCLSQAPTPFTQMKHSQSLLYQKRHHPPYTIAAGNPCRVTRPRFDPELTDYLLALRWWDWDEDKIFRNLEALCSGDLTQIRKIVP